MKKKDRNLEAAQPAHAAPAPAATPKESGVPWWTWLVLAVAAFFAYQPALKGPFLFDDLALPPMNESARMAWGEYFRGFRPLYYIALSFDTGIFGADAFFFHLLNLLYHLVNTALVFCILRRLVQWARPAAAHAAWISLLGAGLFLLHPLQTESVAYIASRSECMSVFFAWCALLLYLRRRDESPRWWEVAAILALLALGVMSKEHVVAVPGVFFLVDYFFRPGFSLEGVRRRWAIYVPFAAGGAAAVLLILRRTGEATVGTGTGMTPAQYLLTQCKVVWIYLRLAVLPFGQNIDWGYAPVQGMGDPLALAGAALLLASLAAAWIYRKRFPLAAMGWLAFLVLLAPTSSVVPIADTLAERRLYLPFLGLLLMLMDWLSRTDPAKPLLAAGCAALAICAGLTYQRSHVYASPLALWSDSIEKNPQNGRAWFQYAFAQYETGQCAAAVGSFEKTAALQKPDYRLLVDWALAYDCASLPDKAIEKMKTALAIENNAHGWATLGMFYGKQGRQAEALEALESSTKISNCYDVAWFYKGNVHMSSRRFAEAAGAYDQALKCNPNHRPAQEALIRAKNALAAPPGQ